MRRNAAYLLVARVVSASTTVVLLSYVGRAEGGDALGITGIGLAIGAVLAALTDAGTSSLLIREGARRPHQLGTLLVTAVAWRVVAIPVGVGILWLGLSIAQTTRPEPILVLAVGLALQQLAEMTRAVFIARERMLLSSIHSAIENVVWVIVTVAALAVGASLEAAFAMGAAVFLTSSVIGFGMAAWSVGGLRPPSLASARELAGMTRPFAAFMVAGVAYSRIDTVLVAFLAPVGAVAAAGAYFSAMRVVAGLEYVADSLARASFPRLVLTHRDRPGELLMEVRSTARVLILLSAPVPAIAWSVGPDLMVTVFGASVAPHAWLVIPLAAILPLRFLSYLFGMTLTSTDAQGRRAMAALVAIAVVVLVDLALIPRYGVGGAAAGSVLASLVVLAVYTRSIARMLGSSMPVRLVGQATMLSLVLVAAIVPLGRVTSGPAAAITVLLAYAAAILIFARRGHTRPREVLHEP